MMKVIYDLVGRIIGGAVLFLITLFLLTAHANAQNLPPGNYIQTCRNYTVIGPLLTAQCKKRDGTWRATKIFFANCDYITNDNGNLSCDRWNTSKLPRGSYLTTCKDSYVDGKYLEAECKKRDGGWRHSDIRFKDCDGDIWNDNGSLACDYKNASELPRGSYKSTCKDIRVDGKYLKAKCKERDGSWRYTDIKFTDCDGRIINDDGRLKCSQWNARDLPKGSYRQTCRGIRMDGKYLEAECKKRDGSWRYTDIKFKDCDGDIWNDNGRLECE